MWTPGLSWIYCMLAARLVSSTNVWDYGQQSMLGSHSLNTRPMVPVLGDAIPYDAGLFSPLEHLSTLSESRFTTLSHPAFPKHSVRIKRSKFCDESVWAYTGYIDIEARHLFFYFFESRSDPEKDDVILWTNGGPGCSSALGLFMELGPCRMSDGNGTKINPHSWNTRANVFFIDQPVGVGFSYAEHGESVGTTEEAAQDIAGFVHVFFQHFTKFQGRAFHLAGESYGGRYLPVFASYIYDQNAVLEAQGVAPINLRSIMIGNGYTQHSSMVESYYDMACTAASVPPILGVNACVRLKQVQIRCAKWMQKSCTDVYDEMGCVAAMAFCHTEAAAPLAASGLNPYDISRKCEGKLEDTLCYPVTKNITAYLDRPEVRDAIGVDPVLAPHKFVSCSSKVGYDFSANLDEFRPTTPYVAALLEHGVKVLIYVGKNDWICNYIGNQRWVDELDWSGKEGFAKAEVLEWFAKADGKAGNVRSYGGLAFLTIDGAGHMAPYDKPVESLAMLDMWLGGKLA